jgi:methoxymalonate biosynthesis protein
MPEPADLVRDLVGDRAGAWDLAGVLPEPVLGELGKRGLLCAQVPADYGGLGLSSSDNGEFTAATGSLCSSLRSVMTSQGMAGWTIQRMADARQREELLPQLASGRRAAVAFSEPDAGSDLAAITTELRVDGDRAVLDGRKKWITAAAYADLVLVVARQGDDAAVVVVPTDAPGLAVRRIPDPLGCRAAGHADLEFDGVEVPGSHVLGGGRQPLTMVITAALAYGRMSVAWGCVGILRACLAAVSGHATVREQFGRPIAQHQLVARHIAQLYIAERTATMACERASALWDNGSPEVVMAAVLAKHVAATQAAAGAATAVQVLASVGAQDGHVVARAYRDAKLMEIIEGSSEICTLLLAEHAVRTAR